MMHERELTQSANSSLGSAHTRIDGLLGELAQHVARISTLEREGHAMGERALKAEGEAAGLVHEKAGLETEREALRSRIKHLEYAGSDEQRHTMEEGERALSLRLGPSRLTSTIACHTQHAC